MAKSDAQRQREYRERKKRRATFDRTPMDDAPFHQPNGGLHQSSVVGDLDSRASVFDQALAVSIATMQQGHAALQRTPADAAVAASVCQTARRTVDLMQQGRLLVERAIVKKCWHAAMLDASGRIAALADTLPEELVRHAPEGEAVVKGILDRQIRAVLEDLQAAPSTWPADVFRPDAVA